jgi:hypothetical protein
MLVVSHVTISEKTYDQKPKVKILKHEKGDILHHFSPSMSVTPYRHDVYIT